MDHPNGDLQGFDTTVQAAVQIGLVMAAVECGFRLGRRAQRRGNQENVPPVSSITHVGPYVWDRASRYNTRRALVRDEANVTACGKVADIDAPF